MASIYRATDERLDRVVCVKLLNLELAASGSTGGPATATASYAHFLREALALSKLQHPSTLRIYDFGYLDFGEPSLSGSASTAHATPRGQPFQISEFLDGGDLSQQIRTRGALTREETLAILERITGAIAEAHEHNIIHRDIKPSNILFGRVGDVLMPKIADFGIAQTDLRKKPRDGERVEASEPEGAVRLFSPRWAAPEQISCEPQGTYTDIYALALVTVHMLTARPPFAAKDIASTFAQRTGGDDFLARRLLELGIGGDLRVALLRALATDVRRRTQSAPEYFESIRQALTGAPRRDAQPVPVPEQPRAPAPREPAIAIEDEKAKIGDRAVRFALVEERLDLDVPGPPGTSAGVRFTIMPTTGGAFRVNIKGLNCFVLNSGGRGSPRPTPAISAGSDGSIEIVSASSRKPLARLRFSFGTVKASTGSAPAARVFDIAGATLVVPFPKGAYALSIDVDSERDVILMCKRA
jgi:serine/threonine-protein kinase